MAKEQFIGIWQFVSFEARLSDGTVNYPWGKGVIGQLFYHESGYMGVQLLRADRPAFAVNDLLRGTPEEIKAAFEGLMTYYGSYTIDEEAQTVTHQLTGGSFPNWSGGQQKRVYEFWNNQLTLRAPPLQVGGVTSVLVLTWERLV